MLPSIKNVGAKVIGITGNSGSTLARYSDIIIDIGNVDEACPFNMAPTTSSTVIMVLGGCYGGGFNEDARFWCD